MKTVPVHNGARENSHKPFTYKELEKSKSSGFWLNGMAMRTDTYNKLSRLMSPRRRTRWLASVQLFIPAWSSEQIMAKIAFALLCILLVGVWVHPYVSGALEPLASTRPVTSITLPSQTPETDMNRPFVIVRGTAGFWRLGKTDDGVWWFISPDDTREFLNTVTTVQPFQMGRQSQGVHYVSRDYNGTVGHYDGDLHLWAEKTLARVKETGFKGLGAWCHPIFHELNVPITRDLNIWKHYHSGNYKLYSADWESYGDALIAKLVSSLRDNRNLVGYYLDNELDWSDASVGPSVYFNGLAPDDPNRRQVIATIQQLWPTIGDFNQAWGTRFGDYTELDTLQTLPRDPTEAYNRLFSTWLEKLAGDYFRITTSLVRKHDPNHLILGVRFAGYAPREVVRASREYTDAQSINYYVADALLDPDMFRMMYQESGQPVIITEYAFHALDGRSGNRNTFGFQAQVPDQQARADGYRLFTQRLARVPYIVGADWFQWSDEPPSGRSADGEDVNFGIVDVDDQPYESLVQAVRETTPTLNVLHARSSTDAQSSLWRDSFMPVPTTQIAYLDHPITINGNLSDWSEIFRLPNVRASNTIGMERSTTPPPNVFIGWRDEGLYLAFEIFDTNVESMPADGRWWTRDNIEFWISTRPVASDQQVYNVFCHQFFYVPRSNPANGAFGTIGQWHRPGDALQSNLIPHSGIVQQTRIHPDRYTVEMFVPASALNGWSPRENPEMAFNLHIRDFHQTLDYFWSAPKEATTQLRPNTWGKLVLRTDQVAGR